MLSNLDLLEAFLNSPPRLIYTHRDTFSGRCTEAGRILSHRYIRILKGQLKYTVDQTEARLGAGVVFFVPCGALRQWEVPRGELCEILWCEFNSPGVSPDPHSLYYAEDPGQELEKAALLRLLRLWTFPRHLRGGSKGDSSIPRATALRMEGELKASLARFWTGARPWNVRSKGWKREEKRSHPSVRRALVWLEQHYRRPDAQQCLYQEIIDLSPNHFRLLFSGQSGVSVSTHLLRLRMQEAMNLLRTSSLSIKEIAAAVGFKDPLYFSKRFHDHWDIAPKGVRR